ncbi:MULTISPECIES: molybdenum cofactor guanylyltransferase MobA [Halomonas]|uniref:molybdenum cofactor guanylyltransferase MobA n=1 Tax=Halomonas TaxID=2745 RepID=UPI001C9767DB|nr:MULTISPECIES: molybdenum cofactor guanylyltransferase MobA [Halomonas]MBY6209117.1 molybdenum cofactor guanylyltransferase [Halomonas sp. DP3Y7-2]MBY6229273.1 molybdenum cofactor guanylyltransferase [Halomonas sp. DP3Y7-1]MCA0917664.1 molybdenum cofactor guanylyltransferase [Halomonas denitrificans]
MVKPQASEVCGVVLAGGQGRRMGGIDKGLVSFAGQPLAAHAVACLRPHVGSVLINANRHHEDYAALADGVFKDAAEGFQGPLMGIYSALEAADSPWVMVVPCDSPLLPHDLVPRMLAGWREGMDILVAHDGERLHPVVALLAGHLREDLAQALAQGERKIDRWYARHAWATVDLSDCADAFANLNTEEERQRLEPTFPGEGS